MKISVSTLLLVLAVLCECHLQPSLASPATGWLGDSAPEQDVLAQLLADDTAEGIRDGPTPATRVIVVGDASLWGTLRALEKGLLPHHGVLENALERRDTSQDPHPNLSVLRRDTMRCMVGRVYRPCWEV